ncbi:Acetyltransferase (GNAT) family protein [Acetitomaculum ruminis DSM 5522]|uniref:Acetyltransferase (GNAT) family protein n=1 Tax=Acetitomaculum ruminis DSM 5522 TaxID=1120918 RepID=A0A1I0YV75_9FIRM|nr:GNAT family N-acetyltransferase [Acetitomaculum ruminis]SFB16927.1 Acetyltransferase (GNAT) family protein [Acetitomaculum ruminis DSM 5522]
MNIRKMNNNDREEVLNMMRIFYDSPALIHKSSNQVLLRDFEAAVSDMPLLWGYIFEKEEKTAGYAMVSLNYTTEYGGICVWVEDLYLKEKYRHQGFSKDFFKFIEKEYPEAVRFKLEVEMENEKAVAAYKKSGYQISDYYLMTKEMEKDEEN